MTPDEASAERASPVERLLDDLSRLRLDPHRRSLRYRAGMVGVALVMVLLPLLYFPLVGLLAWWVGGRLLAPPETYSPLRWAGYFALVALGPLCIFFLIKPCFARREEEARAVPLAPGEAPDLECFVGLLARAVGAPGPRRIELDCGANASAGFAGGWRGVWRQELKLTLGLPLVAGLDVRSFAGVLAHELGHFSQRGGMRLAWFVTLVNGWFERLVHGRDGWDARLQAVSQGDRPAARGFATAALALVWLARQPLWLLMMVARAVSSYALREMEFDADGYEIVFAGSEAFRHTSREINLLNIGSAKALRLIGEAIPDGRLPRNLPLLARAQTHALSDKVRAAVEEEMMAENPARFALFRRGRGDGDDGGAAFSTHPCDRERIEIAEGYGAPGLVHCDERAASLFSDFDASAERMTERYYGSHLSSEAEGCKLVDNARFDSAMLDREKRFAACERFFSGRFTVARPLLFPKEEIEAAMKGSYAAERVLPAQVQRWLRDRDDVFEAFEAAEDELVSIMRASELFQAGFRVRAKAFGLPRGLAAISDHHADAALRRDQALVQLAEFDRLARRCLLGAASAAVGSGRRKRTRKVLRALGAMSGEFGELLRLRRLVLAQRAILQNISATALGRSVVERLQSNSTELSERCRSLRVAFGDVRYPFDHIDGRISIGRYATSEEASSRAVMRSYHAAEAMLERLFDLYFRLVGHLCLIANEPALDDRD